MGVCCFVYSKGCVKIILCVKKTYFTFCLLVNHCECYMCRVSLMDVESVSNSPGICSPALSVPPARQTFYTNSSVNTPARFRVTGYDAVGLPYKQVGAF